MKFILVGMGRPRKSGPPARVQAIIARNLQVLIENKYPRATSMTTAYRALAKLATTSLSQVQRATSGTAAIGVDTLERLADALDTRVIDLVTEGAFSRLRGSPPDLDGTPRFKSGSGHG